MKNSPALDAPLRSEAEAYAISDADRERLRQACAEEFPLSHRLVRALIARLDAVELDRDSRCGHLARCIAKKGEIEAERDRLKADVEELESIRDWLATRLGAAETALSSIESLALQSIGAAHNIAHNYRMLSSELSPPGAKHGGGA